VGARGLSLWVQLCLVACQRSDEVPQNAGTASAAAPTPSAPRQLPSSAFAHSGPVTQSEHAVPGLRVRTGHISRGATWGFTELHVDLQDVELQVVAEPRGVSLRRLLPPAALAVVNGGYFEAHYRPSTWVKSQGRVLSPKSDTKKGGVLAIRGQRVFIGSFSALDFEPELAVQSFPLIVEEAYRPGINSDDGRRAARTVVCLVGRELRFVILAAPRGEGPTLFESTALLREPAPAGFGCRVALNLDGGPSSGVWFGPKLPAKQRLPLAPVGYGIALFARR
jgi:hypothetical protein